MLKNADQNNFDYGYFLRNSYYYSYLLKNTTKFLGFARYQ